MINNDDDDDNNYSYNNSNDNDMLIIIMIVIMIMAINKNSNTNHNNNNDNNNNNNFFSRHDVQLCVKATTGGVWRFPLGFVSTEPRVDDEIVIESIGLNKQAMVGFRLTSQARWVTFDLWPFTLTHLGHVWVKNLFVNLSKHSLENVIAHISEPN